MKKSTQYILSIILALIALPAVPQEENADDNISRNPLDNLIVRSEVQQHLFPEERAISTSTTAPTTWARACGSRPT